MTIHVIIAAIGIGWAIVGAYCLGYHVGMDNASRGWRFYE